MSAPHDLGSSWCAPPDARALPETQQAPASLGASTLRAVGERRAEAPRALSPVREQLRLVLHRGYAFLLWVERSAFGFGTLWFARSLDGGATFEPELALSLGAGAPREAQLAAAGERVTVAWIEDESGASSVWLSTSVDAGARFDEPAPLHEASGPRTERY